MNALLGLPGLCILIAMMVVINKHPDLEAPEFKVGECVSADFKRERWENAHIQQYKILEVGNHNYRVRLGKSRKSTWSFYLMNKNNGFNVIPCEEI